MGGGREQKGKKGWSSRMQGGSSVESRKKKKDEIKRKVMVTLSQGQESCSAGEKNPPVAGRVPKPFLGKF